MESLIGSKHCFERLGCVTCLAPPIEPSQRAHQNVANRFRCHVLINEAKPVECFDQRGQGALADPPDL